MRWDAERAGLSSVPGPISGSDLTRRQADQRRCAGNGHSSDAGRAAIAVLGSESVAAGDCARRSPSGEAPAIELSEAPSVLPRRASWTFRAGTRMARKMNRRLIAASCWSSIRISRQGGQCPMIGILATGTGRIERTPGPVHRFDTCVLATRRHVSRSRDFAFVLVPTAPLRRSRQRALLVSQTDVQCPASDGRGHAFWATQRLMSWLSTLFWQRR